MPRAARYRCASLLPHDTIDPGLLRAALGDASERLGQALRADHRVAGSLRITLVGADGQHHRRTAALLPATALDRQLFRASRGLAAALLHAVGPVHRLVLAAPLVSNETDAPLFFDPNQPEVAAQRVPDPHWPVARQRLIRLMQRAGGAA